MFITVIILSVGKNFQLQVTVTDCHCIRKVALRISLFEIFLLY